MSTDVLSDVLKAVRLSGAVFFQVKASAPWGIVSLPAHEVAAVSFPTSDHVIEFHVVARGDCWVGLLDAPPVRAAPGDLILFPHGDPHAFRSAPDVETPPRDALPEGEARPYRVRLGPAGEPSAEFVCGYLGCDARPFNPLLEALPRIMIIPSTGRTLADLVRLAVAETATPRPGGEALRARLAEMLFVEAVRSYIGGLDDGVGGWLGGLRDPGIGRALSLLHERPSHDWSTDELAREVGLSRTLFHERFALLVGQPPMQYLARWRMQAAAARLASSSDKVAAIALDVGYESEAAFNRAFRRTMGMPPATWRRQRLAPPASAAPA